MVVVIGEATVVKGATFRRNVEDLKVILILWNGEDPFSLPDVDYGIGDHASIAAGTSGAKGVGMVNEELAKGTLNDEPRFM